MVFWTEQRQTAVGSQDRFEISDIDSFPLVERLPDLGPRETIREDSCPDILGLNLLIYTL